MCVEGAMGRVGGGESVEVDLGLCAWLDYYGAGSVGGDAFTVADVVSLVLEVAADWERKGLETYWPAAL